MFPSSSFSENGATTSKITLKRHAAARKQTSLSLFNIPSNLVFCCLFWLATAFSIAWIKGTQLCSKTRTPLLWWLTNWVPWTFGNVYTCTSRASAVLLNCLANSHSVRYFIFEQSSIFKCYTMDLHIEMVCIQQLIWSISPIFWSTS